MRVSELKAWLKSVEDEFDGSDPEIGVEMKTIRTEESPQKHYNSQSKSSIKEINIAKKQLDEDVDRNSDSYIRYIFELISKCFKG